MKLKSRLAIVVFAAIAAWAGEQGTVPKASADKYSAHARNDSVKVGASRMSAREVTRAFSLDKNFARDVNENCVVVEVALYPAKDGALQVVPENFALRVSGQDQRVKPSAPAAAVAAIPYYFQLGETSGGGGGIMSAPRPQLDSTTGINHDPITGMPRRGVGIRPRGTDVGGGVGAKAGQPSLPPERRNLALEMTQKALPDGKTTVPVSGYLYFSVESNKHDKYQLEYTLNGKTVVLRL